MELSDIISPDAVFAALKPNSKRQLLQELSTHAANLTGVDERGIFDTLLQRERLGSTGVGNGVAIPHGKLKDFKKISGMFVKLEKPLDYEALDDQPVDIVFMLLAPEGSGADHLKALSRIARLLRNQSMLAHLREASDPEAIYSMICEAEKANAA